MSDGRTLSLSSLHRLSKKILNQLFNSHNNEEDEDEANMKRKKKMTSKSGNRFSDSRSPFSAMESSTQLKHVFEFFDANGDGKISLAELFEALLNIGEKKSRAEEEAIGIFKQVDRNGDGSIDFEEFMSAVDKSAEKEEEEEEILLDAFLVFDQDDDGYISAGELRKVLERLGFEECGMKECKKMIRSVDKDGDGFVDFQEFKSMMMSTGGGGGGNTTPTTTATTVV